MSTDVRARRTARSRWTDRGPRGPRRDLLIFSAGTAFTVLLISLGLVLIVTQVARTVALRGAQETTAALANLVIAPLLEDALDGTAAGRGELDRAVAHRLRDNSITSLTVWRADGEVVYSSDVDQIGRHFAPSKEITDAIARNMTISAVKDTGTIPGPSEAQFQRMIAAYVPLRLAGQPTFTFEARYSYDRVERATKLLLALILPLCIGAVVLLELIQVPIAIRLARRVTHDEAERAELLERALSASERERRQIAAKLHDGLIQDLAGAGYALTALTRSVPPERAAIAERVGVVVRGAVDALRYLMVDIYPPDLSGSGLSVAVNDLATPLRKRGLAVSVEAAALPPVDPEAATALYRVANEALTNISKHAGAGAVQVSLTAEREGDRYTVLLRVADDGVGLPTDALDRRAEGHLGLPLLIDRIADLGGELTVRRADERGTIVEARVPARIEVI